MVSSRRWLVVFICVGVVFNALACSLFLTRSVTGGIVAVCFLCVAAWVQVVLHECGHLVVAKLMRLPVVAVRIAPFGGWRSEVSVRPSPSATALPLRMVLVYLGGPMTNLCAATVLGFSAVLAGKVWTGVALLGAALIAALVGLINLIPASPGSDGRNLLRWLFAPSARRAALRVGQFHEEVSRTVQAMARGEEDPVHDGNDPQYALAAFQQRCSTGDAQSEADLLADAERLAALARAESTDPMAAAAIGQDLAVQFGLWYLYVAVVNGSPVDHHEVVEISELAQVAFHVQPHTLSTRVAMSLAHLLNQRQEQARSLLLDVHPGDDPPDLCSVALLLRAIAECYLGNRADADHLISVAGGEYEQLTTIVATIQAADPVPPLSANPASPPVTGCRAVSSW